MPDSAHPPELRRPMESAPSGLRALRPGETLFGRECRQRDRIQAVRDRYYREWARISAAMHAEIEAIKRESWS